MSQCCYERRNKTTKVVYVSQLIDTLKIIKNKDLTYQKQVVNTMYNRAKYHPNQTDNMKEAMKIFSIWLKKNK